MRQGDYFYALCDSCTRLSHRSFRNTRLISIGTQEGGIVAYTFDLFQDSHNWPTARLILQRQVHGGYIGTIKDTFEGDIHIFVPKDSIVDPSDIAAPVR
jgi:hypothetical protein